MKSADFDVVVIGSGFGGSVAALRLTEKGYKVAVLEAGRRFSDKDFPKTSWRLSRFLYLPRLGLRGIQRIHILPDVLVLAGAGVGDKRWSAAYRSQILNSRLLGTTTIAAACEKLQPEVFISASAIGYYGETGNRSVTETDRGGDDFLSIVCREWEAVADLAPSVRTIKLRTGLVLDPTGGALGRMIPLFKFWITVSTGRDIAIGSSLPQLVKKAMIRVILAKLANNFFIFYNFLIV